MTDPDLDPAGGLDSVEWVSTRLRDNENEMRLIALAIETSTLTAAFQGHVGWTKMVESMEKIEKDEADRLLSKRMDAYELGRCQGFIRAIRILMRHKPLDEGDVAKLRERATVLRRQIEEDRELLA